MPRTVRFTGFRHNLRLICPEDETIAIATRCALVATSALVGA